MSENTDKVPTEVPQWALELAAQAWCTPENASKEMDVSLAVAFANILARHAPALPDDYWRGYKARVDECMTVQPEPKHPTLWRYLEEAFGKQISLHTVGVNRLPDAGYHFYIHPAKVSGDTQDFLIWPDPFSHQDMIVNKLDSPSPDVEKLKAYLKSALPSPTKETK